MKLATWTLVLVGCAGPAQLDHSPGDAIPAGDGAVAEGPTLVPTGLAFDFLPINSVRGQVTGYDAAADMCVRVIWDFSNNGKAEVGEHCDDFFPSFPYVQISRGACDPAVAYWGNADLVAGAGCVEFGWTEDQPSSVDVTLQVKGPVFTGTIRMKSH